MAIFDQAGKEAGSDAAKTVAGAAEDVAGKVTGAAQDLGIDLADAVSVVATSINMAARTGGDESAAWRVEVTAWRELLSRGFVGSIGGMQFEIKPKP